MTDRVLSRRQVANGLTYMGALCLAASCLATRISAEAEALHPALSPRRDPPPKSDTGEAAWLSLPPTPTLPSTARSGHANVNGASIYYAQYGEGPPVLLLHGGLANSNYWGSLVKALSQHFTVTVMDTRGHGRSPVSSRAYSYAIFADDAAGLMDFLKIPCASIVGWSDGAIAGLQLAMTKPDRVCKLFAFGANGSGDGLKINGSRSGAFASFLARAKAEYAALSPHPEKWPQLMEGLRPMWRTEPRFSAQQLAKVRTPTVISDGEYDEIIKLDHTVRLSQQIPGAKLAIQPRVSHFAMLQNAGQFNRAVLDFLMAKSP